MRLAHCSLGVMPAKAEARLTTPMRLAHHNLRCEPPIADEERLAEYIRLFERQKKNSDGTWVDKYAEEAYNALLKLHEEELAKHSVYNLMTPEAYTKVLGHRSGHQRGMGAGPPPVIRRQSIYDYDEHPRISEVEMEQCVVGQVAEQVAQQVAQREVALITQIRAEATEKEAQLRAEAAERESQLRAEAAKLRAEHAQFRAEAAERKASFKEEMMSMMRSMIQNQGGRQQTSTS